MKRAVPSSRMKRIEMPPIAAIMDRVRAMKARGETVYPMAQAVPWYRPPKPALEALSRRLMDLSTSGYGPDPGLAGPRKALAEDFRRRRGIDLDPGDELHLTCGASQAFLGALMACTDIGERVVVLEPYYFDHVFAVQFGGLTTVSVPMRETDGWELPKRELAEEIPRSSALVLVNPGNPTGCVLDGRELRWLAETTAENGCHLIIDETYERFNFNGSDWHPWQEGRPRNVITFGSFSKSFGMAGWRLGYMFGESGLMEQALKVQDSVVICPPTPSQILLEESLQLQGWVEQRARGVLRRRELCRQAVDACSGLSWRRAGGGFFTLAAVDSGAPSREVSLRLLEESGIATIPGAAFGPAGEGHIRISFGCLSDDRLGPAMEALSSIRL
jgi:aminotransferase